MAIYNCKPPITRHINIMNNGLQSECFEYPTTGDRCEICNSLSHTANRCNHKSINKHKDALWESMVQPEPPDFSAMPKEHLAYLATQFVYTKTYHSKSMGRKLNQECGYSPIRLTKPSGGRVEKAQLVQQMEKRWQDLHDSAWTAKLNPPDDSNLERCPISLEPIFKQTWHPKKQKWSVRNVDEECVITPCGHYFRRDAFIQFANSRRLHAVLECPMCRTHLCNDIRKLRTTRSDAVQAHTMQWRRTHALPTHKQVEREKNARFVAWKSYLPELRRRTAWRIAKERALENDAK